MSILGITENSLRKNLIGGEGHQIKDPEGGKKPRKDKNSMKEGVWTHQTCRTPQTVIRITEDLLGDLPEGHRKERPGDPKDEPDRPTIETMTILMTNMTETLK